MPKIFQMLFFGICRHLSPKQFPLHRRCIRRRPPRQQRLVLQVSGRGKRCWVGLGHERSSAHDVPPRLPHRLRAVLAWPHGPCTVPSHRCTVIDLEFCVWRLDHGVLYRVAQICHGPLYGQVFWWRGMAHRHAATLATLKPQVRTAKIAAAASHLERSTPRRRVEMLGHGCSRGLERRRLHAGHERNGNRNGNVR